VTHIPAKPLPEPEDEEIHFFADRVRVYPKTVDGPVRRFKWGVLIFCLAVYYLLPWLRWDRGEGRPNQALLLDLWHERFYAFGIEIWPQQIYFLTGLLVLGAIGIFLVTSLFGRLWCGYSCPQTVWTDLFMWVECRIEGDRNERMKRDAGPLSLDKVGRKLAKHGIWLGIAFWTGGAWTMYYVDAPTVTREFWTGTASVEVYFMTGLFTATTYLLAGWAREQVCTYMCPWPRFQAAMFDEQTVTVTYQAWRGEPRGKKPADDNWSGRGDCIDCKQCIRVCPTGIDIRDGVQLECINCGLCIDACNQVMTKLDRPNGLIGWDNLARQAAKAKHEPVPKLRLIRPRTIIYIAAMTLAAGLMLVAFVTRAEIGLSVLRDRAPLFVQLENGAIRNAYTIKLVNKTPEAGHFTLRLDGLPGALLSVAESGEPPAEMLKLDAKPDTLTTYRLLVRAEGATGSTPVEFTLSDPGSGEKTEAKSFFLGPGATER
jgi:cytochrome c oxidase accessory protein FixG